MVVEDVPPNVASVVSMGHFTSSVGSRINFKPQMKMMKEFSIESMVCTQCISRVSHESVLQVGLKRRRVTEPDQRVMVVIAVRLVIVPYFQTHAHIKASNWWHSLIPFAFVRLYIQI
jgi:hypothetical protein